MTIRGHKGTRRELDLFGLQLQSEGITLIGDGLFLTAANNTARGGGHKLQLGRLGLGAVKRCSCGGGGGAEQSAPGNSCAWRLPRLS